MAGRCSTNQLLGVNYWSVIKIGFAPLRCLRTHPTFPAIGPFSCKGQDLKGATIDRIIYIHSGVRALLIAFYIISSRVLHSKERKRT